jgi:hypothetical protein
MSSKSRGIRGIACADETAEMTPVAWDGTCDSTIKALRSAQRCDDDDVTNAMIMSEMSPPTDALIAFIRSAEQLDTVSTRRSSTTPEEVACGTSLHLLTCSEREATEWRNAHW